MRLTLLCLRMFGMGKYDGIPATVAAISGRYPLMTVNWYKTKARRQFRGRDLAPLTFVSHNFFKWRCPRYTSIIPTTFYSIFLDITYRKQIRPSGRVFQNSIWNVILLGKSLEGCSQPHCLKKERIIAVYGNGNTQLKL
jgi:hypothetical protein